jgi:ABC-type methionine transport system permease subunit
MKTYQRVIVGAFAWMLFPIVCHVVGLPIGTSAGRALLIFAALPFTAIVLSLALGKD